MIERSRTRAMRQICHDCGVKEGELHFLGCDMERCPFCYNQLITCGCVFEKLGIDVSRSSWAIITAAQEKAWEKLLRDKGRIAYISYPNLCAKCGKMWPEMFHVSDAEWEHYVEPARRDQMLCKACYTQIKAWIDGEDLGLGRKQMKRGRRPYPNHPNITPVRGWIFV
jgi:hypothetical protein